MRLTSRIGGLMTAVAALAGGASAAQGQGAVAPAPEAVEIDSASFGGLAARAIGPAVMGGRIAAIEAVPGDPLTVWIGTASGGVWTSKDGGVSFAPVFDDHAQSIGAIGIDPQSPKTVWVGTGESWVRNSVSVGDGVYRTADGGDTWQWVGLERSERIAGIRVHPTAGDTVWVCATGPLWSGGGERGVYKTTDAGTTWKRTLHVDDDTGCSDLAIDPQDPSILYAGMWQFRHTPWSFSSGGKGSGLYKSTDGGETWRELEKGLPSGDKGRIAVAVAPSRPSVLYALVEAKKTALYRSDDLGESWREVNASTNVQMRPFYFAKVVVDPADFNLVYKPGLSLTISTDGGTSFNSPFGGFGGGVHPDHHALWIDSRNPHHLLLGTYGGLYVSHDRGHHWRFAQALPVSQFYRRDPDDADYVYVEYQGGKISRLRLSTGEAHDVQPLPGDGEPDLRFNWNTPIHLSPSRPRTLYIGAQYLFRSKDFGESWERLSPDLTTNDPAKQQQRTSGGLTIDNSTAENHTTIYSIAESPKNPEVVWVGTDDGRLHVTRDGGASWTEVGKVLPGLPAGTWVSGLEAGRHDEATAFATFDGHATGDMKPYVYKTTDFGRSWTALAAPELEGYAHVVRQDLENPDLLFLGTELGLWISIDGGGRWARFTSGFPTKVAVRDLAVHPREGDLIIATHGRGIYVLDDLTPVRRLTADVLLAEAALLPTRPAMLMAPAAEQNFSGDDEFVGRNPEEAATIAFYSKKRHLFGDLKIEVFDAAGTLITTLPGGKRRGINRVEWPMRLAAPKMPPATALVPNQFAFLGPRVPAGTYTVKLTKGQETYTGQVEVVPDPRSTHSAEDRKLQQETVMRLYRMLKRLTWLGEATAAARDQAKARAQELRPGDRLRRQLEVLATELDRYLGTLVSTSEAGWLSGDEQLREKLGSIYGAINGYDGRPTRAQLDRAASLERQLGAASQRFEALRSGPLAAANRALGARKLAPDRRPHRGRVEGGAGEEIARRYPETRRYPAARSARGREGRQPHAALPEHRAGEVPAQLRVGGLRLQRPLEDDEHREGLAAEGIRL